MKSAFLWVGLALSLRVQILIKLSMLIWLRYSWGCFYDWVVWLMLEATVESGLLCTISAIFKMYTLYIVFI